MKIKIRKFKQVKSTNDVALKLIQSNILEPKLIITEKQTNGRRVGKKWISKKEIFLFLYFLDSIKKINFKQFSILNALLLKKFFLKISKHIKIKWPNDLLFNKEKFAEFYRGY